MNHHHAGEAWTDGSWAWNPQRTPCRSVQFVATEPPSPLPLMPSGRQKAAFIREKLQTTIGTWQETCFTPWWTGTEVASLQGAENLADRAWGDFSGSRVNFEAELDDGYVFHAPVGSFRANAFGLHDLLGNVEEWCEDPADEVSEGFLRHMSFGGSFQARARNARPAQRNPALPGSGEGNIGVRARITLRS